MILIYYTVDCYLSSKNIRGTTREFGKFSTGYMGYRYAGGNVTINE